MSAGRNGLRRRLWALAVAAGLLAGPSMVEHGAAADAASNCQRQDPIDGLVAGAHPVVLVHGWTGEPLRSTRTGLEKRLTSGWQFLTFDYSKVATHWASRPEVSGCLADFIKKVSKAHRNAKGDGKVYLVAHSMGGLASLFAAKDPEVAGSLGGLVTLDTPYRGSAWGENALSMVKSQFADLAKFSFPGESSDAWKCLRKRSVDDDRPDCEYPGYLPPNVPVTQIAGTVTVRRTFFGLPAYDISMSSDGVVSEPSQQGYFGFARNQPTGVRSSFATVGCSVDAESIGWAYPGGVIATMWIDSAAMDALADDRASAALVEFSLLANELASCSHGNMPANSEAMDKVAQALRDAAAPQRLRPVDLRTAPIPASCTHAAGRLVNGSLPGLAPQTGLASIDFDSPKAPVFGDMTGEGDSNAVAVLFCSAGGVSWPNLVLLYGSGPKLLDHLDLSDITLAEHATVVRLGLAGRDVAVEWMTTNGCCADERHWSARLHWNGASLLVRDLRERYQGEFTAPRSCPVADLETAWRGGEQDCLEPQVLGHLFFTGATFSTLFADQYLDSVVFIQLSLRDLGYAIAVDGKYGPQTDAVVRQYQASKGLTVDGAVGLETWRALFGLGAN